MSWPYLDLPCTCTSLLEPLPDSQECSKSSLSQAAQEQLDIYDKDLYLEPACVNGTVPLPVHCNYMGLGQECRGCYMTCEGAMKYMDDFPQEIADWVSLDQIKTSSSTADRR